ncbi:MAG TPA: DEAD/DEAH box helicase [bacterium]|nr:DEAD/DEAH box helicase [bacterium]
MLVTEAGGRLALRFDYDAPAPHMPGLKLREEVRRRFPGIRWSRPHGAWILPSIDNWDDILASYSPEVHPAARTLVEGIRSTFIPVKPTAAPPPDARFRMSPPPFTKQVEAINFCLEQEAKGVMHNALLMDKGTGKTRTLVDLCCLLRSRGQLSRLILFCPPGLQGNEAQEWGIHAWEREMGREAPEWAATILEGDGGRRLAAVARAAAAPPDTLQVLILNYEATRNALLVEALIAFAAGAPSMVACDESTCIKNPAAVQSKAVVRIGKVAARRTIMTGSLIAEKPVDAFGQYLFLDDTVFGTSFVAFRARYCVMGGFESREVTGFRNMDGFRERLWSRAFRCTKAECLDLPPKVGGIMNPAGPLVRSFRMPPAMAAAHRAMAERMLVEVEGRRFEAPIVLTKMLRLQEITSGYVADGAAVRRLPGPNPKAELLRQELAESSDMKVIVWCREREEAYIIREAAKACGIDFFALGGATPDKHAEVEAFKAHPRRAVMAAQVRTGGMGFTITEATLAVYFSNPLSLTDREQSEDRCHRAGQSRSVTYVDLVAEGSIDVWVLALLRGKAAASADLMREELRRWK